MVTPKGPYGAASARTEVRQLGGRRCSSNLHECRCGYRDDPVEQCRCRPGEAERYLHRVSGPLLDRIDCYVAMPRVAAHELLRAPEPEASAPVARRIAAAWDVALARNRGRPNATLAGRRLRQVASVDPPAARLLERIADQAGYSARATHRTLRVARTVADLHGRERIAEDDLAAAIAFRQPGGEGSRRAA